jgi:hypothetical protein
MQPLERSATDRSPEPSSHLEIFTGAAIEGILTDILLGARFRWAARADKSPRQLKEVIQVTHIEVGSVASLGALIGREFHR